jgi:DDE superfamily endonuclease
MKRVFSHCEFPIFIKGDGMDSQHHTSAPPDRGLATQQMSGKKKDKFRLTVAFACNADRSERLPPFFIGKFKRPRCFNGTTPQEHGFHYRNNKKAWMTSVLFEE